MKLQDLRTKSTHKKYALRTLLQGQSGAVSAIAAHPLGTHVACGGELSYALWVCQVNYFNKGEEGTHIWHLPTSRLIDSPTGAGARGVTTAIVWIIRPDDTDDALAFGTDDGYMVIWKRSKKEDEVTFN